jgi:hypothetical protein
MYKQLRTESPALRRWDVETLDDGTAHPEGKARLATASIGKPRKPTRLRSTHNRGSRP